MDLCGFHNISVIQLIKYYNYSQNMGIYSIIPGFCGAPWAVGVSNLIRCQARAGQGLERLGPGPG